MRRTSVWPRNNLRTFLPNLREDATKNDMAKQEDQSQLLLVQLEFRKTHSDNIFHVNLICLTFTTETRWEIWRQQKLTESPQNQSEREIHVEEAGSYTVRPKGGSEQRRKARSSSLTERQRVREKRGKAKPVLLRRDSRQQEESN